LALWRLGHATVVTIPPVSRARLPQAMIAALVIVGAVPTVRTQALALIAVAAPMEETEAWAMAIVLPSKSPLPASVPVEGPWLL